jgi:ABC-type branched-subunit amino acid transport system substrate-binding protein
MRFVPVKFRVSFQPFARVRRQVCAIAGVVAIAMLAGGCPTDGPSAARAPAPRPTAQEPPAPHQLLGDQSGFLRLFNTPKDHPPVRVGLLLPFSNGSPATRALANAMLNAAEMAVSDSSNSDILMMPADEGPGPADAASAARRLIAQGAEIIVGPLFAASVTAVAPIARDHGSPVLAFSTDRSVAGKGVYLLSFQPENEIHRIIGYATAKGRRNFAAMIPRNAYGDRVGQAFTQTVTEDHAKITDVERFDPAAASMTAQASAIAKTDPDALLIAQGGVVLRGIAAMLSTTGIDTAKVKLLGTGLWYDPGITREGALEGGWFAAPAPHAQDAFDAKYRSVFNAQPPQLATLSYDAISLVALLAPGEPYHRFTRAALTDPNGFAGVDGIFRFKIDGTAERGLAILQVEPDGFEVIQPAPTTFQAVGG